MCIEMKDNWRLFPLKVCNLVNPFRAFSFVLNSQSIAFLVNDNKKKNANTNNKMCLLATQKLDFQNSICRAHKYWKIVHYCSSITLQCVIPSYACHHAHIILGLYNISHM